MNNARNSARSPRRPCVLGVFSLLPFLMGGCPEYRNDITDVFAGAVRSALLGSEDDWTIVSIIRGSITDATIDLVFDQFRSDEN